MEEKLELLPVARMVSAFPTKFGIPRQAGLVEGLQSRIVFEQEFRSPDFLRGMEGFTHLWLIWGFSAARRSWSATVRPPRLGGNARVGVFATRSPFRPNPIGLSCVKIERVELEGSGGPEIWVSGADLMDGTPIYDIKPYVPYADAHPEAGEGFATRPVEQVEVVIPPDMVERIPADRLEALRGVLACDPRPSYQDDPERVYGMAFAGMDVGFRVADGILTVCRVDRQD